MVTSNIVLGASIVLYRRKQSLLPVISSSVFLLRRIVPNS